MARKLKNPIRRVQCECKQAAAVYSGEPKRHHKTLPLGTDTTVACCVCGTPITYCADYWLVMQRMGVLDQCMCRACRRAERARKEFLRRHHDVRYDAPCGRTIRARYIGTGNPCWRCGVYHQRDYLRCLDHAAKLDWQGWRVVGDHA